MKSSGYKRWIVCFGGEDWWYHSHAHFDIQVMKHFSKKVSILYVSSIGMRMPSLRRDKLFGMRIKRKLKSVSRLLKCLSPKLYIYSPLPFPFYQYGIGRKFNSIIIRTQLFVVYKILGIKSPLVWINTPTAWPVVKGFIRSGLVYQRTDDYAAYDFDNFNSNYIRTVDDELVHTADLILHVSDELHDKVKSKTNKSMLLPQGVDARFFNVECKTPDDLAKIRRPIVGYVGGMDNHKFDTSLVSQVAINLPNYSFVLIGYDHPNVEELHRLPNIYFLGFKKHEEIVDYIKCFDICILPTAQTDWGLKCRPIKLMEYLAAGKPVIATRTPASTKFEDEIYIKEDASSWTDTMCAIISNGSKEIKLTKGLSEHLKTWDIIAAEILKQMNLNIPGFKFDDL